MSTITDSSGLITKTTVILDKPSDWADWLMLRRDRAEQNDVWEHCDPSKPPQDLGPQPTRPRLTDFKENATRHSQLGKQEQEDYHDALDTFNYESPQWEKKNRALKALASEILATVAQRHLYLLKDRTTAYDRLTTLKQHLCPSDRTRERELQTKYRDLLKSPRGRSIEKWLEEWITITDQCSDLSMAEVAGLRAQEEFLIAVKPIQDSWATNQLDKLYDAHEDGRRLPTVRDLIASFRNFHRRVNPVASSLGTFGASLQAAQPASEQRERAPQAANRRKPKCLCGDYHFYSECKIILAILFPERVPKGFRVDQAKEEKVKAALKNQDKKQRIQRLVEERLEFKVGSSAVQTDTVARSVSTPLAMDDGRAIEGVSHTTTYKSTT